MRTGVDLRRLFENSKIRILRSRWTVWVYEGTERDPETVKRVVNV